jgi:hypothetical protein
MKFYIDEFYLNLLTPSTFSESMPTMTDALHEDLRVFLLTYGT